MLENLIDVWLTEATERSYEAAFAQLLVVEGHRVIQGPMHHAHEHGKDIIAWDPEGRLCAYQLKGGQKPLDVKGVEAVQDQLLTAAAAVVDHPSLDSPTPPQRVYLVTNQTATGPAQSHIRVVSGGNEARGLATLHLVEKAELHSRFSSAQGRFFPSAPAALSAFLKLFLGDGRAPLPFDDFFQLMEAILPVQGKIPGARATQRLVSAAALTTAFSLRQWSDAENHAEMAVAWLAFCSQVLRVAERKKGLASSRWRPTYQLALEEARRRVRILRQEALDADDLVIPHPAEALVYGARALKVCGLAAAAGLSESTEFGGRGESFDEALKLIRREREHLKVACEAQASSWFLISLLLSRGGEVRQGTQMLLSWVASLAQANQPGSQHALPDPYHSVTDTLLHSIRPELLLFEGEEFGGLAYTLQIGVRWSTRRLWRRTLATLWSKISKIQMCEFRPKYPIQYLYPTSPDGALLTWYYPQPTSWKSLREDSSEETWQVLPAALRNNPEFVPFFCVLFPHRFNVPVSDFLDHLTS